MTEAYDGRQVVGMDLHRRRSVLVRMTEDGRKLETVRITNSPAALRAVIARAGKNPRVVIEATYGWYWAVDVLEAAGAEVHLAHPLGVKAYSHRRVKNDERGAADLADLLRMGRLPERASWQRSFLIYPELFSNLTLTLTAAPDISATDTLRYSISLVLLGDLGNHGRSDTFQGPGG